ncbi:MAG: TlyA family RNA methyltransferase [Bacillota bacterium]|nr:TlyA family RNA methyltransferase [Bacillota bacterium]
MKQKSKKNRLDRILIESRPDFSRNRIQAEIMAGNVFVNGIPVDKPGMPVDITSEIMIRETENPYVSRGGLKLEGALNDFSLNVTSLSILDVGASTGGFTDCLLQKGAKEIFALDVGYGQLAYNLRVDPRVKVFERTNIRYVEPGDLPDKIDLAVVDVSFISLRKVLPVFHRLSISTVLALIKPQFEVGKKDADRGGGIIRDPALHKKVIEDIISDAGKIGYCPAGITFSRHPGPKGNIEFFILLKDPGTGPCYDVEDMGKRIIETVQRAHKILMKK